MLGRKFSKVLAKNNLHTLHTNLLSGGNCLCTCKTNEKDVSVVAETGITGEIA
jgi:hypothetical protein